ncbi:GntR family transcriptional regulator [uncultured Sphaerochaeta sp.]|uniref:GntR family transcriptional regulator n=1 Tax=uncultured Sphaerochaeta sp. TaxID=886478 RepID=UPI002A0A2741|nr:GntR family transcriptional regulator [uncultured Sphaerochaeta sp.]
MVKKTRTTTAEEVYSSVKARILNLTYKPGYSLSAFTLSEELQVSRSPVREALIRLAAENLVEIFPQIGTRVSLINLDKVSEERFLRKSLEESAIKEFVTSPSAKHLQNMKILIEEQKIAIQNKNIVLFLDKDDAFHEEYFNAINKSSCWELSVNFTANEHRLRLLSLSSVGGTTDTVVETHNNLITAIELQDEQKALSIIRQHLGRISNEISKLVAQYPEIFTYNDDKNRSRYPKKSMTFPENFLATIN